MTRAEYQEQRRRLEEFRRSAELATAQGAAGSSVIAFRDSSGQDVSMRGGSTPPQQRQDPLIYPGLYSPSGFDMMGILVRVRQRPNPTINIGNIDSGVALVLCDSALPDMPIVYCSEPFENLTGYTSSQILGHNCRFLQHPRGSYCRDEGANAANEHSRKEIKEKFAKGEEARVKFCNFTSEGRMFVNVLTTIPITWEEGLGQEKRYIVGFQADESRIYSG